MAESLMEVMPNFSDVVQYTNRFSYARNLKYKKSNGKLYTQSVPTCFCNLNKENRDAFTK